MGRQKEGYTERMNEIKKQLESRWKQIDKFEASVKTLAEAKAAWRKKLSSREGEIEALKVRFRCCFFSRFSRFLYRLPTRTCRHR